MDSLDFWRLCDDLTIVQAAQLLIGVLPGEKEAMERNGSEMTPRSHAKYVTELDAAMTAISNGLRQGLIEGQLTSNDDCDASDERIGAIDSERSTVDVRSLRKWLSCKGFSTGFFFPETPAVPAYLDQTNERYAPKLAAAVNAWLSVTNPNGRHPKQALIKWLREHASSFGLTDADGRPNETGIEETAKVANWKPEGGAAKTPSS